MKEAPGIWLLRPEGMIRNQQRKRTVSHFTSNVKDRRAHRMASAPLLLRTSGENLPTLKQAIGALIDTKADARGLTMADLARQAGISSSRLYRMRQGRGRMTFTDLATIAERLEVDLIELWPETGTFLKP